MGVCDVTQVQGPDLGVLPVAEDSRFPGGVKAYASEENCLEVDDLEVLQPEDVVDVRTSDAGQRYFETYRKVREKHGKEENDNLELAVQYQKHLLAYEAEIKTRVAEKGAGLTKQRRGIERRLRFVKWIGALGAYGVGLVSGPLSIFFTLGASEKQSREEERLRRTDVDALHRWEEMKRQQREDLPVVTALRRRRGNVPRF